MVQAVSGCKASTVVSLGKNGNIQIGKIRRPLRTVHKGTTADLGYLSFLVENAVLSDSSARGKTILPVAAGNLAPHHRRPHALCHDDAQLRPDIASRASRYDLKISFSSDGTLKPAHNDCAISDTE
jgi:hypothetical protein